MKDATGKSFKIGDKIIYSVAGPHRINAAIVISLKPLRVKIISKTEYGTKLGKEVILGAHQPNTKFPMPHVIIVESNGQSTLNTEFDKIIE